MKDKREILTRQTVFQKLTREGKRSMVNALVMFLLYGIIFGIFGFICAIGLPDQWGIFKILLPLIIVMPILISCVFSFVRALLRMNKANRGEFTVVEDTLTEIRDNEYSVLQFILYGGIRTLFGNKAHLRHTFRFESGKIFIVNPQYYKNSNLETAAEYSIPGDRFVIVCYNSSPDKIVLLFSSKTYTYKDNH